MSKQLEICFDDGYGISKEQACILCHLSAESQGCCLDPNSEAYGMQRCSVPYRENDGPRWDTWMYLISKKGCLQELKRFIPKDLQKKYGIDKI